MIPVVTMIDTVSIISVVAIGKSKGATVLKIIQRKLHGEDLGRGEGQGDYNRHHSLSKNC